MAYNQPMGLPSGDFYLMTHLVQERERRLAAALRPLGISLHEWRALRILYSFSGNVPMSSIVEYSQTDRTTFGRTIKRLEARGWVKRLPSPDDMRAVYLRLNPESHEVFNNAYDLAEQVDKSLLAPIHSDERAVLSGALKKINKNLRLNGRISG